MAVSRIGEQLVLSLDDVRLKISWDGRSPRGLTRACNNVIFKAQAAKSVSDFAIDPRQLDLLERQKLKRPWYEGASPLLPVSSRRTDLGQ